MAAQPPQSRVRLAVGGGLVLLLAVLVAAVAQTADGEPPTTPAATTATTAPPFGGDVRSSGPITIDGDTLRRADLVMFDGDDVALVSFDGTELGRGPRSGWHPRDPDVGIDVEPGGTLVDAPAIDDPLPGCGAVHGRGGIRAAVCGSDQRPSEIHVLVVDGTSRLAGRAGGPGRPLASRHAIIRLAVGAGPMVRRM